jgi:hypothetical protein
LLVDFTDKKADEIDLNALLTGANKLTVEVNDSRSVVVCNDNIDTIKDSSGLLDGSYTTVAIDGLADNKAVFDHYQVTHNNQDFDLYMQQSTAVIV